MIFLRLSEPSLSMLVSGSTFRAFARGVLIGKCDVTVFDR